MVKFDSKTNSDYRQVLRQLKRALSDCRQASTVRTLTEEQRRSLLASLATTELDGHQVEIKDAPESTCEWFLQCVDYKKWSDTSKNTTEDDPILWLKGKAGSGKSTTMKSALVHHHQELKDRLVIAFFFNSRGPLAQRSAKGMYHSLLMQVLNAAQSVPSEVPCLERWKQNPNMAWQTPALKELLEAVTPRLGRPVLCFVDALDECEPSEAQEVEPFFRRLAQSCARKWTVFRACFSSRPNTDLSTQQQRSLLLEEQDGHRRDILTYIAHNLPNGQCESAQHIRHCVQQKASGIFLWAVLAVEALRYEITCGRAHMLQHTVDEMPADLPGLYRHILTHDGSSNLLHCLRLVLFSQKPYSPMGLYYVLSKLNAAPDVAGTISDPSAKGRSMEDQARHFLTNQSRGLVEVAGPHSSVVQFVHTSLPDFLYSNEAISQVWRESPETFHGKSHDILKGCFLSLLQNVAIPATFASEHAGYLEHPGWQDDEDCFKRGLGGPVENYGAQSRRHYMEIMENELFLPQQVTGAAMQYYDGTNQASHPSGRRAEATSPPPRQLSLDDPLYIAARYAVENILYHSNEAEKVGVNQAKFLQEFPLQKYIGLKNTLAADHGHQPDAYAEDTSLLHVLAGENSAELLTKLLDSPSRTKDLDREDPHSGRTPVAAAAARGNVDVLRLLTSSGKVNLDSRGADGRTPLALAALSGSVETLRLLLSSGKVNVESKDADGCTPLALAALSGSVEKVRLLLSCRGVHVNVQDNVGRTPLSLAAQAGAVGAVHLLFQAGADPKLRDTGHRSPLSFAAEEGFRDVSKYLIEVCGVEKYSKDIHGASPLDYADWRRESLTADEHGLIPEYDAVIAMLRKDNPQPRLMDSYRAKAQQQKTAQHESVCKYEPYHPHPKANQLHNNYWLQHHVPSHDYASSHHQQTHKQHYRSEKVSQHTLSSPHEAAPYQRTDFHPQPHIQLADDWQYEAPSRGVSSPHSDLGSHEYDYGGHSYAYGGHGSDGHSYEDEDDAGSHWAYRYHGYEGDGYGYHDDAYSEYGDKVDGTDGPTDDGHEDDDE
ncbi:hypothetical protein MPH_07451 [Macrophomina phaseolina MS6]|uniref:Nephrocystin 3-like N-terminal domain-containing protein n=1 Tax=Macrophomina phaseolina (strain MS6) TaxID=1126212 RepID=K2SEY3_MACPH|nr:hypothetical protein MPH_07451 [Macrophomina phaseolina MS6]